MDASLKSDAGYSLYESDNQVARVPGNRRTGEMRKITVGEGCTIRECICIRTETGSENQTQGGLPPAMCAYEIDRLCEYGIHGAANAANKNMDREFLIPGPIFQILNAQYYRFICGARAFFSVAAYGPGLALSVSFHPVSDRRNAS